MLMKITESILLMSSFLKPTRGQYRKVFIIAACICVIGGTFCNIFISGVKQPWNGNEDEHEEDNADYLVNSDQEIVYNDKERLIKS